MKPSINAIVARAVENYINKTCDNGFVDADETTISEAINVVLPKLPFWINKYYGDSDRAIGLLKCVIKKRQYEILFINQITWE